VCVWTGGCCGDGSHYIVAVEYAGRVHIHPRRMETNNNTVRCRWALKKPILSVRHVRIHIIYHVPARALTVTAAFVTALFTLNRRPDAHGLMGHQTEFDRHPSAAARGHPEFVLLYTTTLLRSIICYCVYRRFDKTK
jgi:hypothetical protein